MNLVSQTLQQHYPSVRVTITPLAPVDLSKPEQTPGTEEQPKEVLGQDTLQLAGRIIGHGAGGGFASYKMGSKMAEQYKLVAEAIKTNGLKGAVPQMKSLGITSAKGAGMAALVSGGVSALTNGIQVARGQMEGKEAINHVITDSISGAVGGLGAVSLAGAGHLALGRLGVVGLPLTIATTAIGAVGGATAGFIANQVKAGKESQT